MDAIETKWRGFTFRSRLEARYAVMFEKMELDWRYEVQGFQLDDGRSYLPDFWLRELDLYVEIKGTDPDSDTKRLLRDFKHPVILFVDLPDPAKNSEGLRTRLSLNLLDGRLYTFSVSDDSELGGMPFEADASLTYCRKCETWAVDIRPESDKLMEGECRLVDRGNGWEQWGPHCEHGYKDFTRSLGSSRAEQAVEAARSARFEHGEDPLG
jgi:hypothetical protein